MSKSLEIEDYGTSPLASMVTGYLMPDQNVSDRTQRAYEIGACEMMIHLASGEWELEIETGKGLIAEFLGRVIANAERQGVIPSHITAQA